MRETLKSLIQLRFTAPSTSSIFTHTSALRFSKFARLALPKKSCVINYALLVGFADYSLISISTPAGKSNFVSASVVFKVAFVISISLL